MFPEELERLLATSRPTRHAPAAGERDLGIAGCSTRAGLRLVGLVDPSIGGPCDFQLRVKSQLCACPATAQDRCYARTTQCTTAMRKYRSFGGFATGQIDPERDFKIGL